MLTREEAQKLIDEAAEMQEKFRHELHRLETALTELNGGITIQISCLLNLEGATVADFLT